MAETKFDLIIIGGGPGGYTAAVRASQLKMKVAVVEREKLGGICLNWGCIPTKALLRTSEIFHYFQNPDEFGLKAENVGFDLDAVVKRSRATADRLNKGVQYLMKSNKVTVFEGEASLAGKGKVKVKPDNGKDQTLTAKNIMIATGARAREMDHLKVDGKRIWTYRHAMTPKEMPESLLVIGSGAIGMEFASFYSDLGAEVTVVEMEDRILPQEDEEVSKAALKAFKGQGISFHLSASVEELKTQKSGVKAKIRTGKGKTEEAGFTHAILAIGIVGNTEGLGLEDAGIKVEKSHIVTDEWGRTGADGIWAIGDITGPPWLAHKASHEGVIAVEKMAGVKGLHPLDTGNIPACTYSRPQVASVGMSEAQAKKAGHEVRTGRFPFEINGKAIAMGETTGFVKTVFDKKTGELLGAHMIGQEVTEMIQGYAIARELETTEAELMHTIFPHPTLSEMMHESVLDAYGRALNK